jgi:hypothetical protein
VKISQILLVFGALLCVAPTVIAQQSGIADETVIIQIDDHLITRADLAEEYRHLRRQYPDERMTDDEMKDEAIIRLVQRALALQAAPKFAIPLEQYRALVNKAVLEGIERAGSMISFLQENYNELGVLDIEEFRDYRYSELVHAQIKSIVMGRQQTPGKGFRAILKPSPAEIRRAYKETHEYRMEPAILKWALLDFDVKNGSTQTPEEIVAKALADLDDGSITVPELIDLADSSTLRDGPAEEGTLAKVIDFLSSASPGEYCKAPKNNIGAQGGVTIIIVIEKAPQRDISFAEVQHIIAEQLAYNERVKVMGDFFKETAAMVDVWVTDDEPRHKKLVGMIIGRDIPVNNPEEL